MGSHDDWYPDAHTHQEIKIPKIPMKHKLSHGVSKIYRFDDNSVESVHGIKIRTDSLTINPFLMLQIAKSTSKSLRIDWKVAKRIQMNLYRCKMENKSLKRQFSSVCTWWEKLQTSAFPKPFYIFDTIKSQPISLSVLFLVTRIFF